MNDRHIRIGMIFIGVCVFIGLGLAFVTRPNGNGPASSSAAILGKSDSPTAVVPTPHAGPNQIVVPTDITGAPGRTINGPAEIPNYKLDPRAAGPDNVGTPQWEAARTYFLWHPVENPVANRESYHILPDDQIRHPQAYLSPKDISEMTENELPGYESDVTDADTLVRRAWPLGYIPTQAECDKYDGGALKFNPNLSDGTNICEDRD